MTEQSEYDVPMVPSDEIFEWPEWYEDDHDAQAIAYARPFRDTAYFAVVAFADPALRRVVARYWTPRAQTRVLDWDTETGKPTKTEAPRGDPLQRGAWRGGHRDDPAVRLRVVVSQYLNVPHAWEGEVPRHEIGRVFSIAHDIYRHVYSLNRGGETPPPALNQGFGSHTWGHCLEQLSWGRVYVAEGPAPCLGTVYFSINS